LPKLAADASPHRHVVMDLKNFAFAYSINCCSAIPLEVGEDHVDGLQLEPQLQLLSWKMDKHTS